MLWVKKYSINMPAYFKTICNEYTEKHNPDPVGIYENAWDSKGWTIWNKDQKDSSNHSHLKIYQQLSKSDASSLAQGLTEIRQNINDITGANLEYPKGFCYIWRYDENFPKCPTHIDGPEEMAGSICSSISGKFKIHLHHKNTNKILDTVTVTDKDLIVLNNTVYPHSVEGQGDLVVFGIDSQSNPEEFFYGKSPNAG